MRRLFATLIFFSCISVLAQNTPAYIQSNTTGTANAASTLAFSSNAISGNALYAVMFDNSGSGHSLSFTDSQGNSWTTTATVSLSSDGDTIAVGCAIAGSTGANTVTFKVNGSAAAIYGSIYEFSGASCTPDGSPVSVNTQNAASCTSGALSTSIHNDLLVGFCGTASAFNSPFGAGTGWSHLLNFGKNGFDHAMSEVQIASTIGSYTATSASFSSSSEQATIEVAFKATNNSICGQTLQTGTDNGNALYTVGNPCVTGANSGGYTVSSISYWVGAPTSASFDLGVYSDSSGTPNSLLCSVSTGAITPSSGWNTASISGCPTLTANTTYWVGYITGSNQIEQGTASGICPGTPSYHSAWTNGSQSGVSLPNPFGASAQDSHCYSLDMTLSTVSLPTPSLTVSSSSAPSTYGQSVTFTATISNGLTGTVTFYDAGNSIGTGTISGTTATFTTSSFSLGSHSITAGWAGNSSYNSVTSIAIAQTVSQATPVITWANPAAITYGVALSGAQLNATANVTGSFSYSPTAGTVLHPGTQTLSTTFTPSDTTDYTTATATVPLTVSAVPGSGLITTVAGNGYSGYSGNGGPATYAKLASPTGVAVDASGNIYLSDTSNGVIRKVTASSGIISTIAGNGTGGYAGDGGPAISAELSAPMGVALDSAGNIYFADNGNAVIRKISASTGIITTIVGDGNWGFSGDGGPATSAELSYDTNLAIDSAGNLYIADKYNMRIRKVSAATGIITTVAGNGTAGYSGDGGPATSAKLDWPFGVAVDAVGNLYIADLDNNVIRKVTASTGFITTIAGNGTAGYSGDSGAATSAKLNGPYDVAFDAAGNLYISDSNNHVIRKVAAGTGIISTVAGNGTQGYSGDGGPAVNAELGPPWDITTDASGNVYIADYGNDAIRAVGSSVTEPLTTSPTIAWTAPTSIPYGTPLSGTQLDATASVPGTFSYTPASGTVLSAGVQALSLLFTPNDTVHYNPVMATVPLTVAVVTPSITWSQPAPIIYGTALSATQLNATSNVAGTFSYSPSTGTVPAPGLQTLSVTFTPTDSVDYSTAISTVTLTVSAVPGPGIITTVAGNGYNGYTGDDGLAISAEVSAPGGVVADSSGNLYIASYGSSVVRKVEASTGIITTIAGNGIAGYSGDGGLATNAKLNQPCGLAIDAAGNIYIADTGNSRIRKVTASTGIITTVAGNGTFGYTGDGGAATSAEVSLVETLTVDAAGNLYIPDEDNNVVRKVAASTGIITTVAGTGATGYSGDGGPAVSAKLYHTASVALDASGNLYIVDGSNNVIRKVTVASGVITTIAGNGTAGYTGDNGSALSAKLNPSSGGIVVDSAGDIYFSDRLNSVIRKVISSSGLISTIAGNGVDGYSGDGGPATSAELAQPQGIGLDSVGNIYIADIYNNRVREVGALGSTSITVTVSPSSATLYASQQKQFSATVTNTSNTGVTWSITPAGVGSINSFGLYTAPATITSQQTVTATATSQANPTISGSATVTLMPTVAVSVSPSSATLYGGQSQSFSATVTNTSNTAVTWSISPTGTGSINSSGNYTAPASITTQQVVTVTATSQADTTKSASATVYLLPPCVSNAYSYARSIVIDHTKVSNEDQLNFPFLFNSTDPSLRSTANGGRVTNSNGYDIIFSTDPSGATTLDYELEKYDPIQGQVVAWVRIPTLSQTEDTVLYMFYGNSNITTSQANASSVWSENYDGVYHFPNGTTLSANDSSPSGDNGTITGVTAAAGMIDGGANFGSSGYVTLPSLSNYASGDFTISTWVKFSSLPAYNMIMVGNSEAANVLYIGTQSNGEGLRMGKTAVSEDAAASFIWSANTWYYVALSRQSGISTFYVNGNELSTSNEENPNYDYVNSNTNIGGDGGSFPMHGSQDEFRISNTARSAAWIATEFKNQSSPGTFYALSSESAVVVSPRVVNLYASQTQQFSATVLAPGTCTSPVIWSLASGAPGTLSGDGLYSAPPSIPAEQLVVVTATSQADSTKTGTASVTLLPPAVNPTLVLAATSQPPFVTGASEQFTAALKNELGTPLSGATVTFTVTGANPTTGNGTTDGNGVASFTYSGAHSGNDTIQAVATVGGVQVTSNSVSAAWLAPEQPISTSSIAGEFFITDGSGAFDVSPNASPVFTQTFPTINFNPPSGTVLGNTSAVNIDSRPFTDITTDLNGNYTGTIVAQGNGYQAGVGPMYTFQAVFRGTFTIANAGNVTFDFFTDDGFILGVANGATRVSGASFNLPLATPFAQFPVMGGINSGNGASGNQVVVNFPNAGTYPFELDYTECCGGPLVLTMTQGVSNPTGVAPTGSLTLSPNSLQPLPIGGQQSFTVLASDASGNPVPNANIGLIVEGANDMELSATSNESGLATFNYRDVDPGTDSVQAVAFISGMVTYSNSVDVPWTLAPSTTTGSGGSGSLSISIDAPNTVILPSTLQLGGSATDSALPGGDSITTTWSKFSGPGTVTFANPQQISTTASFSEAGSYVLQLAASDVNGSTSAQLSVTVNPSPGVPQGWIGSPAYGSAVSCIVPITAASGETLASGTLTFYPANNPGNVTTLNANTTGSGQIGTWDTTVLNNGAYWIALQATDTSGSSEFNLDLVTVTGNCKQGRVTSTVTDLVVPANGLSINIQRTYDSLNEGTVGDFGYGWNLSTNVNLTVDPKGDVTFTLGGIRRTFYLTPVYNGFLPFYNVAFTPEPGMHGTLTGSAPGCSDLFDFVVPDGSSWDCIGGGLYSPSGYIYTDPSGTSYLVSANGNLQSITDKNGNALTINANGITSSTGLSVPFVRDSIGRITEITDPQGNHYQYSYDGNGNLESVTYPNTAQASTYTYDSNHRYLSGTDFRGNALPTTEYYQSTIDSSGNCQGDCDPNGLPLNGRLKSVTDALNETKSYAYNLDTNTTTITYPQDAGGNIGTATMAYDSAGDLLSSTDPLGHTTTNTYDANQNLLTTTDPLGHTTTYAYDSNGNKTSTTYPATADSSNTTSTTAYNQYSEPTSTTDELGNVRNFNYDVNFNPQSVTDGLGTLASFSFNSNGTMQSGAVGYDTSAQPSMASQFTYDANGNMASRTDALGRTTSYTYDSLGHKVSMTEPLPNSNTSATAATTSYAYDAFGNLTQTAAPLGRMTSSTFDGNGNKVSDIDARGNTTTYQYDALNRLALTTYPDSTTSSKTYDFRGNMVTETDQAGHVTKHVYDLAGRQTSVTQAYGTSSATTTTYAYDNAGRKTSESDALSHTTSYTYDAAGNLTAISGVNGSFTYAYDNARNRVSMTDGNSHTTSYQYDARKRLVETGYPDETTKTNAYDGPGSLISVTDQAGNIVEYSYDAANQLQKVTQASSPDSSANDTIVGYDADGNPIVLTDANSHTTASSFDLLGELTAKTLPDGSQTESRSYDQTGNLLSVTHFNGAISTYTYDTLNQLLSRATPGETTVSFTYTASGKRQTMTDASGTTTYSYDSMDRLTSKQTPEGTLSYTYDTAGHVASIASSNSNGASVSYTYDSLNRLSTAVDSHLGTTNYTYDSASNVATATYPNGIQTSFTYDTLNRVTGLGSQLGNYTYQLGRTGNLTSASEPSGRSLSWSYDGIYRLTNEAITNAPGGKNGALSYTLDPVGNRTSGTSSVSGLAPVSGSFNSDDELSAETYDQNGNVLSSGGKTFAYDAENHLISMGSTVAVVYDGDGNRVSKTVSGVTTKYLLDDLNPTGYAQVVDELTGGAVTRTYTYGLQRIGQDQVISSTWTPSFYGYDGSGNVRQLTNSAGAVTDTYEYDAFGNKINSTGTTPNNMLYRGEQYDSDLGLYYLRARFYNPLTGRFLSRDLGPGDDADDDSDDSGGSVGMDVTDSEGHDLTDPRNLHAYVYANGDPVNYGDPTGQAASAEDSELIQWGALTLATGAAIINYEQHKDQTEGALRQLGYEISCGYNQLSSEFISWVDYGLAGDTGTVSQSGPCGFSYKPHRTGKNKGKHQKGEGRRTKSRGPETHPKYPPRKRPKGWKGPWDPGPKKGWGNDE